LTSLKNFFILNFLKIKKKFKNKKLGQDEVAICDELFALRLQLLNDLAPDIWHDS